MWRDLENRKCAPRNGRKTKLRAVSLSAFFPQTYAYLFFLLDFAAQLAPGKPEFAVHHEIRGESKKRGYEIEIEK